VELTVESLIVDNRSLLVLLRQTLWAATASQEVFQRAVSDSESSFSAYSMVVVWLLNGLLDHCDGSAVLVVIQ
jgi:hypothetical protein